MFLYKSFIFTVFLLTGFGLIIVASASGFQSQYSFGNSLYLFSRQFFYGFILGLLGFFAGYFIKPALLKKLAVPFLFFTIILLIIVLIPTIGIEHGGSRRWISIFGFSFQPSEIAKLALILYSSSWLASHKKEIQFFKKGFLPFLALNVPVPLLILLEPNISNFGISVCLIIILLFIAGARVFHLAGLAVVALLFIILSLFLFPLRLERVLTFLNPNVDKEDSSYQINQSLIAIGSGGLFGKGLGQSVAKTGFLPEPSGDAVFAIIAEEVGFVGVFLLIILYLLFLAQGFIIAVRNSYRFTQYITAGFVSLVALQTFINISAVSGLLPLTGVTLPFISYGSTSLVTLLTASGIAARAAKENV